MVNSGEPLLNRRDNEQAKEATRLEPKKVRGQEAGVDVSPLADAEPPAERRDLTPPLMVLVRNVVSPIIPIGNVESRP